MKHSARRSFDIGRLVCPACGTGELLTRGTAVVRCSECGRPVEDGVLATLLQIVGLPDVLGGHACDCGHPEMRRLPGGIFRCPACGSEVLPVDTE